MNVGKEKVEVEYLFTLSPFINYSANCNILGNKYGIIIIVEPRRTHAKVISR